MRYFLLLFIALSFINLNANECVSFEGVKKRKAVAPILDELKLIGINSKVNIGDKCKFKIYLPIDVYIKNDSGVRTTIIYLTSQTDNNPLDASVIEINDTDYKFYDLAKSGKRVKYILIKKHSKLIAKTIKNRFFK